MSLISQSQSNGAGTPDATAGTTPLVRKRGGQKGNQNARKHGFYSKILSPTEICRFWNIVNLESIDPEIASLRIKLQSALQHDPANRRILADATRLLVKWYSSKYRLNRTARKYLKTYVADHLENYIKSLRGESVQPVKTNDFDETNIVSVLTDEAVNYNHPTHEKDLLFPENAGFVQNESSTLVE